MSWGLEQILHDTAFWIPGYKRESYRLGHWRWMQWPDDFNVKMTREAQERYVYWVDVDVDGWLRRNAWITLNDPTMVVNIIHFWFV